VTRRVSRPSTYHHGVIELIENALDLMTTSLIVGYGNTLRSDDGAGYRAAALLEPELSCPEVSVIAAHQLTPEMAEPIARCSRVLFLDAAQVGVPGEIRCERIRRDPGWQPGAWTHDLGPTALLELAARYLGEFRAEPETWLLTITGANFELGEDFSAPVATAWQAYLDRIREWVRAL
jgi:hydrogenase maturation protease